MSPEADIGPAVLVFLVFLVFPMVFASFCVGLFGCFVFFGFLNGFQCFQMCMRFAWHGRTWMRFGVGYVKTPGLSPPPSICYVTNGAFRLHGVIIANIAQHVFSHFEKRDM